MKPNQRKDAFTLIELLTVIAIIGVLIALLFPAIKSIMAKAETTKAQTAITGLSTAFRAYYTEYGKWPVSDTAPDAYIVDTPLYGILKGENITTSIGTRKYQGNPRNIVFLEFKAADLVNPSINTTNFVDPWKHPYNCTFDVTYVNQVPDPFMVALPVLCSGANCLNSGFAVWSSGPDGVYDANGDLPPSAANKDNVKSW